MCKLLYLKPGGAFRCFLGGFRAEFTSLNVSRAGGPRSGADLAPKKL